MTPAPLAIPDSLRARLVALTLLVTVALVAGAAALTGLTAVDPRVGMRAVAAFLAVMLVAFLGLRTFHPFPRLGPANQLTTVRTALVAMVIALVPESPTTTIAWVVVVVASTAASLDGWDGWLARRSRMSSRFGARFDMEVDALLILVLGAVAWRHGKAGSWVLLSGALRYLFVAAGWLVGWLRRELPPSTRRKAVCVVQIVGLIVVIGPVIPRPLSDVMAASTLALLAWSFAVDVRWLARGGTS